MNKWIILALPVFALVLMGQGCNWNIWDDTDETQNEAEMNDTGSENMEEETRADVESDLRGRLTQFESDYDTWTDEVNEDIAAASEDARGEIQSEWDRLRTDLDELYANAANRVNDLTNTTAAAWADARVEAEDAIENIESAFEAARNDFDAEAMAE